jgi:arginase family enzyme
MQGDFLGGMALAGAVGLWDAGVAPPFPASRVVLAGVSDLDEPERENIERSGATVVGAGLDTLVAVQNALDAAPVYIHFDSDVLDSIRAEKLYDLLEAVADESEIVGVQVNIEPEYVEGTVGALEPVLKEAHVHH